ncbi:hypothetical protein [Fluviicola chungangensis]|uniref:Lipoprotein n=1 Tax=Fluviicola chungangensis TaxID=2597671 RepID=A0A556MRG7_9FLAO|nr:hypothetical protein [Fluviicola chungangensis]TSJ42521.1 hypothetical protein FO442_12200 [Fluviicola chungangensis]
MNKVNYTLLMFLTGASITITSCGESTREKAVKSVETEPKTEVQTESEEPAEKSKYLIENKVLHAFSDPKKQDEFQLVITGESLLKGKAVLTITSSEGKDLLKETFDANFLLGYDFTGDIHSKKETDAFITKRVKEFFSEDRFTVPAIEENDVFEDQSYYIDKATWEEIKSNRQAIGFYYLLGSEDGRHVAFSKQKGKAVMYYNCC